LIGLTLISGLIPAIIFAFLMNIFAGRFPVETNHAIQQGQKEQWQRTEVVLKQMVEDFIHQKALDVVLQLELYLQAHPEMTLHDLQNNSGFRKIAVQPVGKSGYTAVQNSDTAICRFHKNPAIENMDLHFLVDKLSEFWTIMEASLDGKYSSGFYLWKEPDGKICEKFMCIAPLGEKTADGIRLGVAATTYIDEFIQPIVVAQNVSNDTTRYMTAVVNRLIKFFRTTGFLFMGIGIVFVLILAFWVGSYLSRSVTQLRDATRAVNQGNFEVRVKSSMSGDVGELVKDFNRMITKLATTTVKKEQLEASEARYSGIFNATTDSLIIFDDNGIIVEANPQACLMYGYSYEEIVKLSGKDIVHPDYHYFFEQFKKDVHTSGEFHAESLDVRKDGSTFNVEVSGSMFNYGDRSHLLAVIRDVTSRKQADKLIRAQRDLGLALVAATGLDDVLRLCVDAAINISGMDCGGVYLVDKDSKAINLAFHKGLSATFVNCVSHYDRDSDNMRLIMAGKPVYKQYKEILPNINDARCNEKLRALAVVPVKCEGRIIGCLNISSHTLDKVPDFARSTLESISTQIGSVIASVTANTELNKEKERFRVLVEKSPFGISLIKKNGRYEYINSKFTELFGYTLKDIPTGKEWFKKAYPDSKQRSKAVAMWFQLKNNTEQEKTFQQELNVTCRDSSKKTIFFRMVNMEAGQALVLYEDITKTKRLEKQFQQAQKMEAIGTLAGGIAHDFNNLLMGIHGCASLMAINIDSKHPHFEYLKDIKECVKNATGLTKQLLGFARAGRYEVKPIDINAIIEKSSGMFARTKKEITIHRKYQKDIWTIEADHGQMEQVLLNLYVNAWHAMPGGGKIYLKTENVMIDKNYKATYRIKSGRYVKISITDTGMGMDEATRQKVFDPFFTTKEMGRGTGLGLASVYGIIKHHGGFINVYSENGEGSTFNVYLPASTAEKIEQDAVISKKQILRGNETILFVDDENMIIDVGKQMLEIMGYKILTANNGKQAIDIYKKNMAKIDIVILDMIMPDIGGSEVYDRLKKINPEIKVLLSSGYSVNGQATEILNRGCDGFIQKPFSIKNLSNKLKEMLNSA